MRSIINLVKTTVIGGLIFLVPFFIIVIIALKAFEITRRVIRPWAIDLGIGSFAGRATLSILVDALLLLICFVAGLIAASGRVRSRMPMIDAMVGKLIPGYEVLKAQSSEEGAKTGDDPWQAILLKCGEEWRIAFVVEKDVDGYSTVFIPGTPKLDIGEIRVLPSHTMEFHSIPVKQARRFIIRFGEGAGAKLQELIGRKN